MPSNLIQNGGFERSDTEVQPWFCTGGDQCGTNNPEKGDVAAVGRNYGYMFSGPPYSFVPKLSKSLENGHHYNLSYFAYSWNWNISTQRVGWTVQASDNSLIVSQAALFNDSPVAPQNWPFWNHRFTASENSQISWTNENNTLFFIDEARLECLDCSSPSHDGAIAGGVVGSLAGLSLLVFFLIWSRAELRRRGRRTTMNTEVLENGFKVDSPEMELHSIPVLFMTRSLHDSPPHISMSERKFNGLPEIQGNNDLARPDIYPDFENAK